MKMKGMLLASLTLLSGAVMLTACSANQRKASDSKTLVSDADRRHPVA